MLLKIKRHFCADSRDVCTTQINISMTTASASGNGALEIWQAFMYVCMCVPLRLPLNIQKQNVLAVEYVNAIELIISSDCFKEAGI